jgi:hypothetical protein
MKQTLIGSKKQLAAMLDLSERQVTNLITAKILPVRGPKGFDFLGSVRGYIAFLKKEPGNIRAEKLRHQKIKSDLLQLQLEEKTGTLVLRSVVEKKVFELNRQCRDAMLNIPSRVSGMIAAENDQAAVFKILTAEIHQACENLSKGVR